MPRCCSLKGLTTSMIERNLGSLYKIRKVPSDTSLRERLDRVSHRELRTPFKKIFAYLQRGKILESYRHVDNRYIISLDGIGQFSSNSVHCKNCCEKHSRSQEVSYHYHMLGAALVHPDKKVVIPLAPEPIVKGDGATKMIVSVMPQKDCYKIYAENILI